MAWMETTEYTWQEEAACRGLPPKWFFPVPIGTRPVPTRKSMQKALNVCDGCPVGKNGTDECFAWAMENGQRDGIWGGRLLRNGRIEF